MITDLNIGEENFDSIEVFRQARNSRLRWELVFTLPVWLRIWWENFGSGKDLHLRSVRQGNDVIGISPLKIDEGKASIIGSPNVCDYQDFITSPGSEKIFFDAIFDDLRSNGVESLELESLRPDSCVISHLIPLARERGWEFSLNQSDVSLDMDLPADWEEYLGRLDRKQRHELRRKMRNLQEAGGDSYRIIEEKSAMPDALNSFLHLFPDYRKDKAEFMTSQMSTFFRSLSLALAEIGILRFGALEIGNRTAAMIMYFDYFNAMYLYNSAYDPEYRSLSVGIINKARCIQDGIQRGKRKFDFLKGSEQYKYYLGGKEIPLYNCSIAIK